MIRLIVSDIDGTLVPEGNINLNPEYMDVIKKLTEKEIFFAAASGRQSASIDAIFSPVRDCIYYLSDNGACIERFGEPVYELRLNEKATEELLKDVRKIPTCYPLFSTTDGFYTDTQNPKFHELIFGQYGGKGAVVDDLNTYISRSIKLSLYCLNGAQEVYDQLNDRWKDQFSINISGDRWVDFNAPGATKGNAVKWLQEEVEVTPEETVIFGDNFNDMSMFSRAYYSFASELSHPDVKAAARFQVASWKVDGVLAVLKQILKDEAAFRADQGNEAQTIAEHKAPCDVNLEVHHAE